MGDTNYFSGIVQILETPKEHYINSRTQVTKVRASIPLKYEKVRLVYLNFWGFLGRNIKNSYKKNDYLLIEGYISLRNKKSLSIFIENSKQTTITGLKVRPVFLD